MGRKRPWVTRTSWGRNEQGRNRFGVTRVRYVLGAKGTGKKSVWGETTRIHQTYHRTSKLCVCLVCTESLKLSPTFCTKHFGPGFSQLIPANTNTTLIENPTNCECQQICSSGFVRQNRTNVGETYIHSISYLVTNFK